MKRRLKLLAKYAFWKWIAFPLTFEVYGHVLWLYQFVPECHQTPTYDEVVRFLAGWPDAESLVDGLPDLAGCGSNGRCS